MLPAFRIINKLRCLLFSLLYSRFFGSFGKNSSVLAPAGIEGIGRIHISDNVYISNGTLLAAMPYTDADICELRIGRHTNIGRNNHIYATSSICIEPHVLTANNVYISDNTHGYENIDVAIKDQPIQQRKQVVIGAGAWLGQNVCVLGASVGKGSVIGANSVVLHDVPDYCVAVGTPARVIRRYNTHAGKWVHADHQDNQAAEK